MFRDGDVLSPSGYVVYDDDTRSARIGYVVPKGTCTWCGEGVKEKRRRTWCSESCVDEFKLRTQAHLRDVVIPERDHGRCRGCKLDTVRLRRLVLRLAGTRHPISSKARDDPRYDPWLLYGGSGKQIDVGRVFRLLKLEPPPLSVLARRVWWDMDHETPIVEGGDPFALDNLRTLCLWCHRSATAELSTRRASRRRAAAVLASPQGRLFDG